MIYGLLSGFKVLDWDEPVAKVATEVMGTQAKQVAKITKLKAPN